MNLFKNMRIGVRLNIVLSLVMVITTSTLGVYVIINQKNNVFSNADIRMFEQVEDLARVVNNELEINQARVNMGMEYTEQFLKNLGSLQIKSSDPRQIQATNQITKNTYDISVATWEIENEIIHESNTIVDVVTDKIGGTATIFQRIPQGYLRISTNVINKQGKRGTGTFIPNESPVAKSISNGNPFYGRAFVVDDWYRTGYKPILNNSKVVGIIYYGVKEKDLAGLKDIFKSKEYYNSGYPYMVASDGEVIIHPTKEGESFAETLFFRDMKNSARNTDRSEYIWEGQDKIQYFTYVEAIDAYVSSTIYKSELLQIIHKTRNAILIAIFLGIGLFIGANTLISRSITSALNKGVAFAKAIASGSLDQNIDVNQKDEVGELANALNSMVVKLKGIVTGIVQGAESIASASQQLSSTSEQLSQGASEQASSVEEVSSTMEEIAANIEQNTENAAQTESISLSAQEGIRNVSEKSVEAISANRTISEKINVINDIAFQTNLLALNAAVEAARAGEHGKGFAVVAAEVRKLAENSKVAADEIVTLATQSLSLSENAGEQMKETLPHVENSTKLVQEISAASTEQNNGANQVNNAIQQLSNVTQQNAAAAEEMATSSEELASQASALKETITFFKIEEYQEKTIRPRRNLSQRWTNDKNQPSNNLNTEKSIKTKKVEINMGDSISDSEFEQF